MKERGYAISRAGYSIPPLRKKRTDPFALVLLRDWYLAAHKQHID